jgi:sugar-specific transcriptional regulator TrmB
MIVQKEFLNKLKDFGLNTYESKLWTALLSRGVSTAGELSDIANVPRSRSYDVLESLEKKGFIIMRLGKPIKYMAVQPVEVLERVKKKIEDDAKNQMNVLDSIKKSTVINELNLLHNQGVKLVDPTDLSGNLKGRNNLYQHLDMMIKSAQESITIMTTTKGLERKADRFKNSLEKAAKKGVKVRIVAPVTKENADAAKELGKFVELKNTAEKARFCIVDGKEVVFMLIDDETVHPTYDTGIWVSTKLFAATLENFFDSVWSKLKPADKFIKAA